MTNHLAPHMFFLVSDILPKETHAFLLENHLDDETYNKAIQKMIESYRISAEDKEILRGMKRKLQK
jgi:hypothetical protein